MVVVDVLVVDVLVVDVLVVDVLVVDVLVVDVLVVDVLVVDVLVVDVLVVDVLVEVLDVDVVVGGSVVVVLVVVVDGALGNVVVVVVVEELVVVVVEVGGTYGGTITSGPAPLGLGPVVVSSPVVPGTPLPVSARGSFTEAISSSPCNRSARSAAVAKRGGVGRFFPQTCVIMFGVMTTGLSGATRLKVVTAFSRHRASSNSSLQILSFAEAERTLTTKSVSRVPTTAV